MSIGGCLEYGRGGARVQLCKPAVERPTAENPAPLCHRWRGCSAANRTKNGFSDECTIDSALAACLNLLSPACHTRSFHFDPMPVKRCSAGRPRSADAVRMTLGPKSKSVLIGTRWGRPIVCNDGVTIAREFEPKDPEENLSAHMLRSAPSSGTRTKRRSTNPGRDAQVSSRAGSLLTPPRPLGVLLSG